VNKKRHVFWQCLVVGAVALLVTTGYAKTEELVELAKVAGQYNGVYFAHVRNESGQLLEAMEESVRIGREAEIAIHIYHLKAAGQDNWPLMARALERLAEVRRGGMEATADIYPYIRNGIGLRSFIHPRHYAQGQGAFLPKLSDPEIRRQLRHEIETDTDWENWYQHVGKAQRLLVYLAGQRALHYPCDREIGTFITQSILDTSERLTRDIEALSMDSLLRRILRAMQAACRGFLDENQSPIAS